MTLPDLRAQLEAEVLLYVAAAHAARAVIAALSLLVAIVEQDAIPGAPPLGVLLAFLALLWTLAIALQAASFDRLARRRPRLVFVDSAVLVVLMALDKPWDSLVALPYGAFVLLVPYARPTHLAVVTALTLAASYAPKLIVTAAGWRHAELTVPVTTQGWVTQAVGPIFAGTVTAALCLLIARVREATGLWEKAQAALAEAEARSAEAHARLDLADRLHDTLSQALRAIPLRLEGAAPQALPSRASSIRNEVSRVALDLRSSIQRFARELRDR